MMESAGYKPTSRCFQCGGECCRTMPGIAYPEDFAKPLNISIETALKSGNWSIDWYEGDVGEGKNDLGQCYYLRPATKTNERGIFDPSWGGECVFLTVSGCKLSFENRPKGCRFLEPGDENCNTHGHTKKHGAIAWLPYQELLRDIGNKLMR